MDRLKENELLEHRPNTLEVVRRDANVDKRKIDESIDLLAEWLKKQSHFVKKEYTREYLERSLVSCKGSVERTKQKLDSLATYKTLMADFYENEDVYEAYETIKQVMDCAGLPKITTAMHRVGMVRLTSDDIQSHHLTALYMHSLMIAEYLQRFDYVSGFQIVIDLRSFNPMSVVTAIAPLSLKKILTILIEGYSMRLKGLHFITTSKLIDALISLVKPLLSDKLRNRINVHKDLDSLHKMLDREILPKEYGGEEKSLKELHKQWVGVFSSEDNMNYFREMKNAATVETYRQTDQFNEKYIGTPGSFRMLSVD